MTIKTDLEYLENDPDHLTKCQSRGIPLLVFEALFRYSDSANVNKTFPNKNIDTGDNVGMKAKGYDEVEFDAEEFKTGDKIEMKDNNSVKTITLIDPLKNTLHQHYRDLPAEMEVDVRGSVRIAENHCTISMGEIKSSPKDISTAKNSFSLA